MNAKWISSILWTSLLASTAAYNSNTHAQTCLPEKSAEEDACGKDTTCLNNLISDSKLIKDKKFDEAICLYHKILKYDRGSIDYETGLEKTLKAKLRATRTFKDGTEFLRTYCQDVHCQDVYFLNKDTVIQDPSKLYVIAWGHECQEHLKFATYCSQFQAARAASKANETLKAMPPRPSETQSPRPTDVNQNDDKRKWNNPAEKSPSNNTGTGLTTGLPGQSK